MIRDQKLGEGTFGIVYRGFKANQAKPCALKRNLIDNETSFIGALREVDLLNKFRHHPHIVALDGVTIGCPFTNSQFSPVVDPERVDQRDDMIHFEFNEATADLHHYIYGTISPDFALLQRYMVDILLGLEYLHGHHIIHRDLKPSNILIFAEDQNVLGNTNVAKICDFGLAKPYTYQGKQTPSIVTTIFRAPEIALGCPHYDYKSDLWSIGCLFFEMIARKTFISGTVETNDQILSAILGALPMELPSPKFRDLVRNNRWRKVKLTTAHLPRIRRSLLDRIGMSKKGRETFETQTGPIELFLSLLTQLLQFEPDQRINATQALDHPFFASHSHLIAATRAQYQVLLPPEEPLKLHNCVERRWMSQAASQLFNDRASHTWYTTRILFQAMDLFDRYLSVMAATTPIPPNAIESESKGFIHDRYGTELRFLVCIYLCVKYFSSIHYPIPFTTIGTQEYQTPEAITLAEQFEGGLVVNCLEYDIYRGTIYEAADTFGDQLDELQIRDLIILYSRNTSLTGWTPRQVYSYYRDNLRGREMYLLLEPLPVPPIIPESAKAESELLTTVPIQIPSSRSLSRLPPPPPKR